MALSFGFGIMMGSFWSGGWGCGSGWCVNNVYINHNNNFNRNSNIGGNRNNIGGNRPSQLPAGDRGNFGNRGSLGGRGNSPSTLPAGRENARSNWQLNPDHRGGGPSLARAPADS